MEPFVADFIDSLQKEAANSDEYLIRTLAASMKSLGFKSLTYGAVPTRPLSPKGNGESLPHVTTVIEEWRNRYIENKYYQIDPILRVAQQSLLPITWEGMSKRQNLTKKQTVMMRESAEFGTHFGVSIPIHGTGGDFSILTLYHDYSQKEATSLLREYQGDIQVMAVHFHVALQRRHEQRRQTAIPAPVTLTEREVECLMWIADGKTDWEISSILGISESTVAFHVSNAMRKFGVHTRPHAVARMIHMGLAHP